MTPRTRLIDAKGWIFLVALAAICVVVPALNLGVAPGAALHLPTYLVSLFGKYLAFALLALSLDLVWGFCGILSLGHGAFFGLGGYAMGMYLMRQIGARGVYGNPVLPDFMVFLNYKDLPWYWLGFDHFAFAALMVLAVPGLLGFVVGWLAFRSRVTGVYLSIITFRNDMGLGGNNGLTDFKDFLGLSVQSQNFRVGIFVATGIALAIGYLIARFMTVSAYGKILIAVRDAESRTRFLGYRPEHFKTLAFTVSAMMAGVAGALYVPQVGIINPGEFAPTNSIEAVIWVAVGGRGTLVGAALGAVVVNYAKTVLTGAMPDAWLFALGALFVVVTLFLPRGIVGTAVERFGGRRAAAKLPPEPEIAPKLVEEGQGS